MAIFSKILKKIDISKRLSVPTKKRRCFLNFRGKHHVEFKAKDKNGRVWSFGCSIRKKGRFPKPVLSRGWLPFVRFWKLAIYDEVILHDKDGEGYYRIEGVKRSVQNLDADTTTLEPAITSHSDHSTTDWVGSELEFSCPKLHMQVREPKFTDFFALESQKQRGKEQPSFPSPLVEPCFYKFL